jgi:hypothetical protein
MELAQPGAWPAAIAACAAVLPSATELILWWVKMFFYKPVIQQ